MLESILEQNPLFPKFLSHYFYFRFIWHSVFYYRYFLFKRWLIIL